MKISFSPQRMDGALAVSRAGDMLSVNGDEIDLSVIPDGATLPADAVDSKWIVGPVERIDGVLHLTLLLPHGPNPSQAVAFPAPIVVTGDGPVAVPQEADHGND